jgi:hypothetical protein
LLPFIWQIRKESEEATTNLKNKELPIEKKGSQQTHRASFLEDLAGMVTISSNFLLCDLPKALLRVFVLQLPKMNSIQCRSFITVKDGPGGI